MELISGSAKIKGPLLNPVVTIGNFDGVHRGHQEIFQRIIDEAKKISGCSVVYTFEPHPARILAPEHHLPMLQTLAQKSQSIHECGIDTLIVEPFTREFAKTSAHDFFSEILSNRLTAKKIIVGYDFTFGIHRSGTTETLQKWGSEKGIEVEIISPLFEKETFLSSTHIRLLISAGNIEMANRMLGRPYEITGNIQKKRGIGRTINIPTANLHSKNEIIPAYGVYVTEVRLDRQTHHSVTNIGFNPTTGSTPLSIESHILDFSEEIVGKDICLRFLSRIRDEQKFQSLEDLKKQIQLDIQKARIYHETKKTG